MADRPAKRLRRSTLVLSDEDDETSSPKLPLRSSSKANAQLELDHSNGSILTLSPCKSKTKATKPTRKSTTASPKSSPEKSRNDSKLKKEPEKTKSLHTFFSKATEEQRWQKKSNTPEVEVDDPELEDAIEDDDLSDETLVKLADSTTRTSPTLDRRKSTLQKSINAVFNKKRLPTSSSQRFVKPAVSAKRANTIDTNTAVQEEQSYHRPWADRYGPTNLDELAVHRKKVADVRGWLENVLAGRDRQKLLVLKGPAGSGKTTTVSLLAQALGFGLVFWQNPAHSEAGASGSVASQFDDFLRRGGLFGSLSMTEDGSLPTPSSSTSDRRVMMVEEFPTTMSRSSSTLHSFRSVLLQYLARQGPRPAAPFQSHSDATPPMIMIISETLLSSSTAFSDSFTAHRLLGPEILNHPSVTAMDFNPVAPTFVSKALDTVVKKEARDSKRRRTPGPAVLHRLAEIGDIRSAVNSLEFLCIRGDNNANWSGTVAGKTKMSSKDSVPLTDMEKNSLQLVCQRETTLDMFHAVGKVVYNKREDPRVHDSRASPPPRPPDHLMYSYTPKISQVDIEALLNETGTDIQTFISTLHENYVLSCDGDSFVDCLEGCAEILSISDVLNPDSRRTRRSQAGSAAISQSNVQAGTSDTLRQDEISFQTATRGLLFKLPHPVSRAMPVNGRKTDSFKMFYPASLRLWKPTEEIDSLISLFVQDESIFSAATKKSAEGVASWKARGGGFGSVDPSALDADDSEPPKLAASHDDLALEILPYMMRIRTARKQDTKILGKIAQFHGVVMSGDEPDEEELNEEEAGAMGGLRRTSGAGASMGVSAKRFSLVRTNMNMKDKDQELEMEKLYISDDDIQDS